MQQQIFNSDRGLLGNFATRVGAVLAMTGLLLAGVDPIDAVIVQLLVMLLVLGTVAVSVVTVVTVITRAAVTPRLTLADWARFGADGG